MALQGGLPDTLKQHNDEFPLTRQIPFEQRNWIRITDAMAQVVEPGGTAAGAHIEGVDFAGKTGTAQTISHAGQARAAKHFRANAWFVGVMPRRNPEIVVAVLFEGGEEGPYAARLAAQVVKAYADKQRRHKVLVAQQHANGAGAAQ
jgi:penicillin-binding protein 2